jgi:carbon monoxide dehydrogenase subunit G
MKIDNRFTVSAPIDQAWAVLTDLEGIAPCMPGAQLTGVQDNVYSGKVKIKVGPVTSEYAGTARFVEKDDADYRAVINAAGRDSRGAGNATATITAQLRAEGAHTAVSVETDLKITGKIAQFGSGVIKEISEKLLGQFVDCLEGKLTADVAPTAAPPAAAPPVSPTSSTPAAPSPAPTTTAAPTTAQGAEETQTGRVIVPERDAEPLNLMSIAGGSIYKRLIPLIVVVVVVVALIIYFVVR